MGGRGSGSATSRSGQGMQKNHYDQEFKPTRLEKIQNTSPYLYGEAVNFTSELLGVGTDQAREYNKAVAGFTGVSYTFIRQYQRGEIDNDYDRQRYGKMEQSLESYIDKAPKWGGGETFRGVSVSSIPNVGDVIDMGGTSSWTTNSATAKQFADTAHYDGLKRVIFRSKKQSRGVSVRHLSAHSIEDEVTVSKKSRFKVSSIKEVEGITYIDVMEV